MQPRDLVVQRAGLASASSSKTRSNGAAVAMLLGVVIVAYLCFMQPATSASVAPLRGGSALLVEAKELNERLSSLEESLEAEKRSRREAERLAEMATKKARFGAERRAAEKAAKKARKQREAVEALKAREAIEKAEAAAAAAASTAAPTAAPTAALPDAVVVQPLPNCSVVFFHHLEKTAGTTLRSIFQRHAQLGLFDFFSFVNRYNKVQFQMVTHRLDTLLRQPGGLAGMRLAVEIHIGGGGYEQFLKYTLPDLLLLRAKLRGAGCRCNLVTLLRHPLMAHISWHHHFVNERVPLCFWNSPFDCQSRMAMALACHGGPGVQPLREPHHQALARMWAAFDLVGVTERFDEFLILLTDLVGLQVPATTPMPATTPVPAATPVPTTTPDSSPQCLSASSRISSRISDFKADLWSDGRMTGARVSKPALHSTNRGGARRGHPMDTAQLCLAHRRSARSASQVRAAECR